MKALLKTLAIIFFCVSLQYLVAADQFTMTPSADSMNHDSMNHGNHDNHDMPMDDTSTDSYWRQVRGDPFELTGQVRTYYIAAEEVVWDYGPDGYNRANGTAYSETALEFMEARADRIGSKYLKCLYKEYTDGKFNKRKARPAGDAYLGFLGPTVRAEVGDIIKIVFLNRCRFPASLHPHAVFYYKDSEGALYGDGTGGANKLDDGVKKGHIHTYTWYVPERAGPGPMDGSSVMWMYHSHCDENKDFYAGLVGCMEVTRKGMARADGSPKDVDREIFLMYSVGDENASPYLNDSFAMFSKSPKGTPPPVADQKFVSSNQMHAINGYMYGNGPLITVKAEERVRWYLMSMGSVFDSHTPHWHGNTLLVNGMRMDVVSLLVAEMVVADMVPDDVGIWLFHCHVNAHMDDGMVTRYEVKESAKKKKKGM